MVCQKTVLIVLPTTVTAPIATTASSAARSPYSSRSWPSSERRAFEIFSSTATATCDCMATVLLVHGNDEQAKGAAAAPFGKRKDLRRGRERVGDVREDNVHRLARERDAPDRDERDERDEQRVFEQVLAF